MEQPSIFPFGIRIDEPVTMSTDVLVGLACLIAAWKLKKYYRGTFIHKQIILYFVLMGVRSVLRWDYWSWVFVCGWVFLEVTGLVIKYDCRKSARTRNDTFFGKRTKSENAPFLFHI